MTPAYRSLLFFCFGVVLFTASCKKGAYVAPVATATTVRADESKLNDLFSGLRAAPQDLVVTAGFLQTVYGAYGTKLTFYPNSFKDADGNVIKKGIINIRLTEIYTPGDMIANRVTTTSGGSLLTSGGQVQLIATLNGKEVFANRYGIGFRRLAPAQQPMSLFYGGAGNPDSMVNWASSVAQTGTFVVGTTSSADTNLVVVITSSGVDTITTHGVITNYYQFDSCVNFNWINCDYFYTSGQPLTNVRVMVPDTSFNQSNTEVFIVFPGINAAAHMTQYNPASHTFDLQQGYYVPVGLPIDIVVAAKKGVSYYFNGQNGLTISNNMFVYADMPLVSLDYIRSHLSGL